jgi:hypothetical protein
MHRELIALSYGLGLLFYALLDSASAHQPYFSQSEVISGAGSDTVQIKLLRGDGIIAADPYRAVIVAEGGRLLGASPMSTMLSIDCEQDEGRRVCRVYDAATQLVFEPSPEAFRDGGIVEADGRPLTYPEDITAEFGFEVRSATAAETLRFEAKRLLFRWPTTLFAVAWWAVFWVLGAPLAEAAMGRNRRHSVLQTILRLAGLTLMAGATTVDWAIAPDSLIHLLFALIGGSAVGVLIAKLQGSKSHTMSRADGRVHGS